MLGWTNSKCRIWAWIVAELISLGSVPLGQWGRVHSFFLRFIFVFIFRCVWEQGLEHGGAVSTEARRGRHIPEAKVRSCELPDGGFWSWTLVLCKSSLHSYLLSHPSNHTIIFYTRKLSFYRLVIMGFLEPITHSTGGQMHIHTDRVCKYWQDMCVFTHSFYRLLK